MTTISLSEASSRFEELLFELKPGEVLLIADHDQPMVELKGTMEQAGKPRRTPGAMKGTVLHMADDFDAPLEDFEEYMS